MERSEQVDYLVETHEFDHEMLAPVPDDSLHQLYEKFMEKEEEEREVLTEGIMAESDQFDEEDLEETKLSVLRSINEEVTLAFDERGVY